MELEIDGENKRRTEHDSVVDEAVPNQNRE